MHMRVFVVLVAMTAMILGLMNDKKYTSGLKTSLRSTHVTAMAGNKVFLPCHTQPSAQDKVEMVLWFKKTIGKPIYRYDVRGRPMSQPKFSSSEIGTRAYFYATVTPAILLLENVTSADSGIYWCRVDFLHSATRNYMVNLTVITPPNQPTIIDARTQDSIRLLEPYNEGDTIELLCEVKGGNPRPSLIWYLENTIIDETFEEEDNGVTSNALTFPRLGREHLNARLSCQASNTNLSPPPSKLFILNINLRPLSVQIVKKQEQLSANRRYEIECIVTGSRPAAEITWWIGSKPLRHNVINFSQSNLTRSVVQLVPEPQDHERLLICHAENPHLRAKSLEDTWKLDVQYVPIVSLKISLTSKKSNHTLEGDDVYLECTARANPRPSKLFWFKQGMQIEHNASAGVFVSEQSLLLQNVIRNDSGEYKCAAQNDEGKSTSNPVNLQVSYPPACISSKNSQVLVVLEKQTVELTCEVNSSPPPYYFMWLFNNSKENMDIDPKYYKTRGSTSTFLYTPRTEEDFGVVSCLAVNTAGLQDEPCRFILAAPTLPTNLQNCSVLNRSVTALQVECQEGFDGGLPQVFHMEVLELPSMNVLSNVTSNIPLLAVTGLPERARAHYLLLLYASNAKGRSEIERDVFVSHNRLTESPTPQSLPPMLGFFVALGGLLTASICAVLAAAYRRNRTYNNRPTNNTVDSSEHDDTYTASQTIDYSRQFALELGLHDNPDNPDHGNGDNIEEMEMFAVSDVLRIRGNRDSNDVPSNNTMFVVDCDVTPRSADIVARHGPNVHDCIFSGQ